MVLISSRGDFGSGHTAHLPYAHSQLRVQQLTAATGPPYTRPLQPLFPRHNSPPGSPGCNDPVASRLQLALVWGTAMGPTGKKSLSEQEIRSRYITPAIVSAGWDLHQQVREEFYITKGRVIVRGSVHARGPAKRADYVLFFKPNIPVAVIEAKDNTHSVAAGMQQALDAAAMFDVPFAFSSNGDAFLAHDSTAQAGETVEQHLSLDRFPPPDYLWDRYCAWKDLTGRARAVAEQAYHPSEDRKAARYYQSVAVNRTVEAIARGQQRVLLVMATGTGKTFTAFQILWRLWKAGSARRVLFLVDRNILADQAFINDFQPFGDTMTKITGRTVDKSYEVYVALYQAITGADESSKTFTQFSRDFFDVVVVDECHRGSAAEDSAWREILEHFASATQIGLTATPKETEYVSNIDYFGEPVFTYSLRQGIDDGFLAPYKVVRLDIDKDLSGWRPEHGQLDRYGAEIEDRIYNSRDYDKSLVLEQRTQLVAERLTEHLKRTDRYAKTIVFCEDIDHAERMRQALVNANADLTTTDPRYVVRITGDSPEAQEYLDGFIDPESTHPVIATTSRLMSTGVDAQTCKVIVLDRLVGSMTEFKQIIGRGTRIREDYGKYFFSIMDFRKATELFADPDFDGVPIKVLEEGELDQDDEAAGPAHVNEADEDDEAPGRVKYYVDDVPVTLVGERVQYYGKDGRLVTESLTDYTRKTVSGTYTSLDQFLRRWKEAERKAALLEELERQGLLLDALAEEVGREYDAFDLICHVAFDQPPKTRRERAEQVRGTDYFSKYGDKARTVLESLLQKYAEDGVQGIEDIRVLNLKPISDAGTPVEIVSEFGGRQGFDAAVSELEDRLYA